jgi:hypothetical protein
MGRFDSATSRALSGNRVANSGRCGAKQKKTLAAFGFARAQIQAEFDKNQTIVRLYRHPETVTIPGKY